MAIEPVKTGRTTGAQKWFLISILILVAFGSVYFTFFYKPLKQKVADLNQQEQETKEQSEFFASQLPDLGTLNQELELFKIKINDIDFKNKIVEKKLLTEAQLNQFLTELIKCADGLVTDFHSVKQNVQPDKPGFSRLFIDMKFQSRYEEMVNYVHRIERISPYVKIEDIDIAQAQADPRNLVETNLKISAILGTGLDAQNTLTATCAKNSSDKLTVARSPLTPSIKTIQKKIRTLKVIGITYRSTGFDSSAIINDTIVKEGDEIDGQKVQKILPDSVVLNDGQEDYTLSMTQ